MFVYNTTTVPLAEMNSSSSVFILKISITELDIWLAFFALLCCTGAFGNISLLVVIFFGVKKQKHSEILIAHVLAIYTSMCAVHYPFYAIIVYGNQVWKWNIPEWWCEYIYCVYMTTLFAANWADMCIAANRFVAVFTPHSYKRWTSPKAMACNVIITWVGGFIPAFLPHFGIGGHFVMAPAGACAYAAVGRAGHVVMAMGIYIPLVFIGFCYVALFSKITLTKITKLRRDHVAVSAAVVFHIQAAVEVLDRKMQRRVELAWTLFVSFLWYCLCYLPVPVMNSFFSHVYLSVPILFLWLRTVMMGGSALNPVRKAIPKNSDLLIVVKSPTDRKR